MTTDQARQLLAYMAATWRVEFTEAQQAVWEETFADRMPAQARAALRALKETVEIIPSHAEFVSAYNIAVRRGEHERTPEPTPESSAPATGEQRDRNLAHVAALKQLLATKKIGKATHA